MKFLNYNINGLLQKIDNSHLIQYITSHDFVCLTESFIATSFESDLFNDYCIYTAIAKKLSHQGRYSGGVVVMVRKQYSPYVKQISTDLENMIVLKIDKELLQTQKDVMLMCSYIPPYDSAYWKNCWYGIGIDLLEQCILDLHDSFDDFHILLCGDLNARTASENYTGIAEDFQDIMLQANSIFPRKSQDLIVNTFGQQLLDFCNMYDCVILNGLCEGEHDNSFTYIASCGASVLDYYIMSCDLYHSAYSGSLVVEGYTESDHLPVVLTFIRKESVREDRQCQEETADVKYTEKIVWSSEKEQEFVDNMRSNEIQNKLKIALDHLENHVEDALCKFVECLTSAGSCMVKKCYNNKKAMKAKWFDEDCRQAKKESRSKLKVFRSTRSDKDRKEYVEARKRYRYLLKAKKQSFRREKTTLLAANLNNPSTFWKELRNMGCGKQNKANSSNIDINEWYNHFKDLFANNDTDDNVQDASQFDNSEESDHFLNEEITELEVQKAIKKLKCGKACGLDGITAEMLKAGGQDVELFLTRMFNVLFEKGIYPQDWAKAIVIPIHKKGNTEHMDNYRGVSLLSVVSKCYTSVLNARLYFWLEENAAITECQAGFRKNYSTVDQIFNLYAIVQKCLRKKGQKLYVAFVDFRKAFDSVRHDKLLDCIRNQGIKGKFFGALRAMYNSLLSCIRANCKYSEFFECPVGVRQGCVLSPTLFSLFINQLANHVTAKGRHGIQLVPGVMELFILLFADDVALLSTTPTGLQNQLDCLKTCCQDIKMEVNKDKTKIMVFRKGGFLAKHEKWFYNDTRLEVVNNYCYLGFNFTTKLSCKQGTDHLAAKGKKAVICLSKAFQKYKEMTYETFFKIFDSKVQPILLYSSEIWGLQRLENIEKIHLMACKRFLGVPVRTPNKMVYGDLGRFPLFINSYISCIKYWFRLLEMGNDRLPKTAYEMLLRLDRNGKDCWVSKIREILCETGFNFVWLQQGVGDKNSFLRSFKQRLVDMFIQEWSGAVRDKDRYEIYRSFKTIFEKEKYILNTDIYCFRVAVSQARFGVLPLNNNLHRYSVLSLDRNCAFCINEIENEHHFLFKCPMYADLRRKFIPDSSFRSLKTALEARNQSLCRNVSKFIFHATNKRKQFLDSKCRNG